jgi:flavin reductase (DIM6/NTAB) family NADH-FMN oxidoreductase RutF
MDLDPAAIAPNDTYKVMIALITPRPIGWVSTLSPAGVPNLAPFSFFNGVGAHPPTVVFSVVNRRDGSKKDTLLNVEANGEFVVNIASYDLREAVNGSSVELPYEVSEFERCGLTPAPSLRVRPPRVREAKAHMECVVHQIVVVGEGPLAASLVIGRILLIHVDDAVLDAEGRVAPAALDTIGRMGGDSYARTTEQFALPRPRR